MTCLFQKVQLEYLNQNKKKHERLPTYILTLQNKKSPIISLRNKTRKLFKPQPQPYIIKLGRFLHHLAPLSIDFNLYSFAYRDIGTALFGITQCNTRPSNAIRTVRLSCAKSIFIMFLLENMKLGIKEINRFGYVLIVNASSEKAINIFFIIIRY